MKKLPRNIYEDYRPIVKEMAKLLREDESGDLAAELWRTEVRGKGLESWIAEELWEWAERLAYPPS